MMRDKWEQYLQNINSIEEQKFKHSIVVVTDTIMVCIRFWELNRPDMKPTSADIIEMAKMILNNEGEKV
jgi:hypothetical protein